MADLEGKKSGGRVKGTPNKKSLHLNERAKELGVDPFKILLHFAAGDYEALGYKEIETKYDAQGKEISNLVITPELRCQAAEKACQYLYPKRKAVEISTGSEGISINISTEDQEL